MSTPLAGNSGDAVKRALIALKKMQARIDVLEHAQTEPVAIVGVGCRFPGGATDPAAFWKLLSEGRDGVCEVPRDRWDAESLYDPDPDVPGFMSSRQGCFLEHVDRFDPHFFGIAPREALAIDPQQRLLLEVAWEALENAGQAPAKLQGSRTGVFIGVCTDEYSDLAKDGDLSRIDTYYVTGNARNLVAGRLSYFFGLQGPSIALDTACSSSLVGVHLACQQLRLGECSLAIAGGVNLILSPEGTIGLSRARMMAPDGKCKTFDAAADGYGRGEGCGIVILKRLSDAVAAGDRVLAVVLGSAVNHDGRSSGLTVPNGLAQEALIREALKSASVAPADVDYVEAHGTGTSLGDPIEIQALASALGEGRTAEKKLLVGSVKTNIGHLEGAAGIAGLIKVVLSLQHREIPRHLNFTKVNPEIPLDTLPIAIPTAARPWPVREGHRRVAGVSSFGFSGTNSHIVLAEAPSEAAAAPSHPANLLCLSAKSDAALRELAQQYEHALADQSVPVEAACFTANVGRSHFPHRLALTGESAGEIREKLGKWRASGQSRSPRRDKVAFLFTGQGSQYAGMGKALYAANRVFRESLDACDEVLQPYLGCTIGTLLYEGGEALDQTARTQPALFALEWAICEVWRSWGVRPDYVMGHSVGEYVAACVAGILPLRDGLRLIAERGRLMQSLPAGGTMAAVLAAEERVLRAIAATGAAVSVAAVNGPENVVISGPADAVTRVTRALEKEGAAVQPLRVSHAFHSALMDPILAEFRGIAASASFGSAQVPLVRNIDAALCHGESLDADYWTRHLRNPVRFREGIQRLRSAGCEVFLEVGPDPVLSGMGRRCCAAGEGLWLASLRRGRDDLRQIADAAGELYAHGADIEWERFYDGQGRKTSLPTYPFQRQRCWVKTGGPKVAAESQDVVPPHPLLGRRMPSALAQIQFQSRLAADAPALLGEHRLYEKVVVPGAVEVSMALDAAAATSGSAALRELTFIEPIILPESGSRTVQMILTPEPDASFTYKVYSCRTGSEMEAAPWSVHAAGTIAAREAAPLEPESREFNIAAIQARCTEPVTKEDFYAHARRLGFDFGPRFRWIERVWRKDDEALAEFRFPEEGDDFESYRLNPGLIDSIFTVIGGPRIFAEEAVRQGNAFVPLGIDRVRFYRKPAGRLWCHASLRADDAMTGEVFTGTIRVIHESGEPIVDILGIHLRRAKRDSLLRALRSHLKESLYDLSWEPASPSVGQALASPGTWLVFSDRGGTGQAVADLLRQRGKAVRVIARESQPEPQFGELLRGAAGALYLWGLDDAAVDTCESALRLVQALEHAPEGFRLWVATRGAQAVRPDDPPAAVSQAPLWGLGRVAAQEYPDRWGGLIDLDPAHPAGEVSMIVEQLDRRDTDNEFAFRGESRSVPRLVRAALPERPAERRRLRPDATYLITGGSGGLGLRVAARFVERGARHLALIGRSQPGQEAAARIAELRARGADVRTFSADVAREDQIAAALCDIQPGMPPLRGVIHAAGVLDDGVLRQQDWARFSRVLAPKTAGAWNLHAMTRTAELDFFVMFSSLASLVGSPGQANYAAGNAFLDSLAAHRRALGLPAVSINWGPWAEAGMAAALGGAVHRRWQAQGMDTIAPDDGLEILEQALQYDRGQVAVLMADWPKFEKHLARIANPLLSRLAPEGRVRDAAPQAEQIDLARLLSEAPAGERWLMLSDHVRDQALRVLGLEPGYALPPEQALSDLGLDSLMALDLTKALAKSLGRAIPPTLIFNYPTVEAITGHLAEELALDLGTAPAAEPPPDEEDLSELSRVELKALLDAELASIERMVE
jgi:malonyl CoA-acyl carrier protein transacylase